MQQGTRTVVTNKVTCIQPIYNCIMQKQWELTSVYQKFTNSCLFPSHQKHQILRQLISFFPFFILFVCWVFFPFFVCLFWFCFCFVLFLFCFVLFFFCFVFVLFLSCFFNCVLFLFFFVCLQVAIKVFFLIYIRTTVTN